MGAAFYLPKSSLLVSAWSLRRANCKLIASINGQMADQGTRFFADDGTVHHHCIENRTVGAVIAISKTSLLSSVT
jgi:hypothetical protein